MDCSVHSLHRLMKYYCPQRYIILQLPLTIALDFYQENVANC